MRSKTSGQIASLARRQPVYKQGYFVTQIERTPDPHFEVTHVDCAACGYPIDTAQGGFQCHGVGNYVHRLCPSLKERRAMRQAALES